MAAKRAKKTSWKLDGGQGGTQRQEQSRSGQHAHRRDGQGADGRESRRHADG